MSESRWDICLIYICLQNNGKNGRFQQRWDARQMLKGRLRQ